MKKIVGILGMAAVLASAAFAADPAANFVMSEFKGSASFGWKADLKDTDNVKMGMFNDASGSLKFGFVTAGDKVSTGDGVWGEIKISNKASDAAAIPAVSVDTAKIHFVDGDFTAALNIAKPSIKYGGVAPFVAVPTTKTLETGKAVVGALDSLKQDTKDAEQAVKDAEKDLTEKKADLAKATVTDFETKYKAVAKAEETLKNKKEDLAKIVKWNSTLPAGVAAVNSALGTPEIGDDTGLKAGLALELGLKDVFDFNFRFMDDGVDFKDGPIAKDKKYGLGFGANLTAVKDLTAGIAASFNFGTEVSGFQANAAYKIAIDDKLYVKPGVTYEMIKTGKNDATHYLATGVMFGWGASGLKPELDFIAPASDKFAEGVSVALMPNLNAAKNTSGMLLSVGLYDESLFNLLGLTDFGKLQSAVQYETTIAKAGDVTTTGYTVAAALKYGNDFGKLNVKAHAGMQVEGTTSDAKGEAKVDPTMKFAYGVRLGSAKVIDNTDIYISYEGAATAKAQKADKSEIVVGTTISF